MTSASDRVIFNVVVVDDGLRLAMAQTIDRLNRLLWVHKSGWLGPRGARVRGEYHRRRA